MREDMRLQEAVSVVGPDDGARVLDVWEASVRATHDFVTEADIEAMRPLVGDALPHVPHLLCVRDLAGQVAGFIGVQDGKVEMLFVHPDWRGRGIGRRLLSYAVTTLGASELDVNEQNPQALGFYLRMGFEVIGRSAVDGQGNPYPLLHMRLRSAAVEEAPHATETDEGGAWRRACTGADQESDVSPAMLTIEPLTHIDQSLLQRLIIGYQATAIYRVARSETDALTTVELRLTELPQPFVKRYDPLDSATFQRYAAIVQAGYSFAAYENGQCVALAIAEPQSWNASLSVWEFHVAPTHQGQRIGRRLMEAVADHARGQGLRVLVCETQSTNVPAIRFYRALGFVLDGIDLSLYSNQDYPDGEIAIFMKRHL